MQNKIFVKRVDYKKILKFLKLIILITIFIMFFSNKIFDRYYEKIEYVEVKGIICESEK